MENVENSISEPLNLKNFWGMICHRFQAPLPSPPPPSPTASVKNTLRRPWEEEKKPIDALISYEARLSSILAHSSFHKS